MPAFEYTSPIIGAYPTVIGGVLIGSVKNAPSPDTLTQAYQAEQERIYQRVGDTPLSELEPLSAWRSAFRGFGVNPTKYRSAAEALLRRLTKKGSIPGINTLVDVGNLVSIRYYLPVAIFDVRDLSGDVLSVRYADGTETFLPLGAGAPEHPDIDEVIFADSAGEVYARRWCWRQSRGSAAREDTTQVIVTVEAHHDGGSGDINSALDDLQRLLTDYAAFQGQSGVVSAASPAFSA